MATPLKVLALALCVACVHAQEPTPQAVQDCNIDNIFTGRWIFSSDLWSKDTHNKDGFAQCPATLSLVQAVHSHGFGGYHPAHFNRSDGCRALPLTDSLKELLLRSATTQRPTITFVGDSLSHYLFLQSACGLESVASKPFEFLRNSPKLSENKSFIETEDGLDMEYIYSRFLRAGLPCRKICPPYEQHNLTHLEFQYYCSDCPTYTDITEYTLHHLFPWTKRIRSTTKVLILQAGAWYTKFETPLGGLTYGDEFAATIPLLGIMLGIVLREHPDMEVFWVDMPPYVPNSELVYPCPQDQSQQCQLKPQNPYNPIWGRELYKQKSDYVRAVFAAQGHPRIHVLNTHDALRARVLGELSQGTRLMYDGLHWKSPGPLSVPLFVFESIMHLYATRPGRHARTDSETLQSNSPSPRPTILTFSEI